METFQAIQKSRNRIDVHEQLTGRALYGADLKLDGMLHAKGVQSRHAHARIIRINTDEARACPGVACVLTAQDIPGDKTIGEEVQDQFIFSVDRVLHKGDVVALVVAETMEIAISAAALVKVDYEVLPAVTDRYKAVDNEQVIHPRYPRNICSECHAGIGNVEEGLKLADVVLEQEYRTGYQEHSYIEPEAVIAVPGPTREEVTVKGCIHNLFMTRLSLKRSLLIPMGKATVIAMHNGGSFGGKLESPEVMAVRAALAAMKTGRPVKYVLTREESIEQSYKRHPFDLKVRAGATGEGLLTALSVESVADGGAYTNMSPGVIFKAVSLGTGPYRIPNTFTRSRVVFTNNIVSGSFRGFGNPQAIFARELCFNELAERLNMSPYAFRRKNVLKTGDVSGTGQKIDFHNVGALECLDKVAQALDYENKYWKYKNENENKTVRRGVGLSLSYRGNSIGTGLLDVGRVYVDVKPDASVLISIGLTELGQGLHTVMCQFAAEALGIDIERVWINESNSSKSPPTGACVASRGTYVAGSAINDDAGKIKTIIGKAVAKAHGASEESLVFASDRVSFENRSLTFDEAVRLCYNAGLMPAALGAYVTPELKFDHETGQGDPFYQYTYSCIGVELELDTCTGKTRALKVAAAHDIGRAINPKMARGQMVGGAIMAQGYGLFEDLGWNDLGAAHNNFDDYRIPTAMDAPEVEAFIVENPDERGPYGARSLGEPSFDPGGAAYVNAVNHALGESGKIRSLPASLEKVLFCKGIEQK